MASLLPSYSSNEQEALRKLITKPLVKHHDMGPEMYAEAVELITMAVDKHATSKNYEAAATMVKNTFDKKFGNYWHVAIGEGFGFEVTHQQRHIMFLSVILDYLRHAFVLLLLLVGAFPFSASFLYGSVFWVKYPHIMFD